MLLYTHSISPRLEYIAGFIFEELIPGAITLTSSREEFIQYSGPRINYSSERITTEELWIIPHGLLHERGIKQQHIECFERKGCKAFFKTGGDLPYDIFAASFYLLSRYEEYLPHKKDMYGRYSHGNSIAWREGFLNTPLVNRWLKDLENLLKEKFPSLHISSTASFSFLPTYDIDMGWSYLHKGWLRTAAGLLRSALKGEWELLNERIKVFKKKQPDPFDAFDWLDRLHGENNLKPIYFFLVPEKRGRYDKNISPSSPAMQELIRRHAARYPIGIHPSWKSGDDISLLKTEIETLSRLTGSGIYSSRQHYIRFNLPEGYRRIIANGIRHDYSMGYGSINGFRASVASPFFWYDLEREQQTPLRLYPFCFMEANSFYEQKNSAAETLEEMRYYYQTVKSVNGQLIMIWHNSFLGTDRLYRGWREIYDQFIKENYGK